MSDDFLDPIIEQMRREGRRTFTRAGQVTAIDAPTTSMTVDCAGDVITGVRWYEHFTPVVGDFVDLLCVDGSSWRALGVLDNSWTEPPTHYDGEAEIVPTLYWGSKINADPWTWAVTAAGAKQGRWMSGATEITWGTVGRFTSPASVLPVGATITAAKIGLRRSTLSDPVHGSAVPVSPRIYQHTYTTAPSGAPSLTGTVWSPGTLLRGEVGQWDLPSAWLAAWVAGTITGFAVYSTSLSDVGFFDQFSVRLSFNAPIT